MHAGLREAEQDPEQQAESTSTGKWASKAVYPAGALCLLACCTLPTTCTAAMSGTE